MSPEEKMQLAIEIARQGVAQGQTPFGAVVARGAEVVAVEHNTVWRDTNPTAHAEINALRAAAAALRTIDLSGCTLYSTCEPCPMCLSAIHWARIDAVYFGAGIEDAETAGFHELRIPAKELARMGGSPLRVESGPLRDQCVELFHHWRAAGLSKSY